MTELTAAGLYDPPSALQPATAKASPTLPNQPTATTPASAAATPTTVAVETSIATPPKETAVNTPSATPKDPSPSATEISDEDRPTTAISGPDQTAADPEESNDQTDPSPAAPANPTNTGIGDLIASVIGLIPSAISAESGHEGSAGNAQTPGVNDPSNGNSDGANNVPTGNVPGSAQSNTGGSDQAEGGSDTATPDNTHGAGSVATFVADGTTYTAVQATGSSGYTAVLDDGVTLSVGGAATTLSGGQAVSLGSNSIVVNNGGAATTANFQGSEKPTNNQATFVDGGTTYTAIQTAGSGTAVLGGATLSPGGPAATLANGETVSLGPAGVVLIDNGKTSTVAFEAAPTFAQEATFAIDGTTYTALGTGRPGTAVVDDQTLTLGGPSMTINGETISIGPGGPVIVDDGRTTTSPFNAATSTDWILEAVITAGSSILTAYSIAGKTGELVLDGTTLTQGGSAITINGEVFSLGRDGLVESDATYTKTLEGVGVSTSTSKSSSSNEMITSLASSASESTVTASNTTTSGGPTVRSGRVVMVLALLMSGMTMFMW